MRRLDEQDVAWAEVGAQFLDSLIIRINVANGAGAWLPAVGVLVREGGISH